MPEPIPLGLTFLSARMSAISRGFFVKVPSGGNVETVFTVLTQPLCQNGSFVFLDFGFVCCTFCAGMQSRVPSINHDVCGICEAPQSQQGSSSFGGSIVKVVNS